MTQHRMEIIGYSKIAQQNLQEAMVIALGIVYRAMEVATEEAMGTTEADGADGWMQELAGLQLLAFCVGRVNAEVEAGVLTAEAMPLPLNQAIIDATKHLAPMCRNTCVKIFESEDEK